MVGLKLEKYCITISHSLVAVDRSSETQFYGIEKLN